MAALQLQVIKEIQKDLMVPLYLLHRYLIHDHTDGIFLIKSGQDYADFLRQSIILSLTDFPYSNSVSLLEQR